MKAELKARLDEHQKKLEARGVRDVKIGPFYYDDGTLANPLNTDSTKTLNIDSVAESLCDILDALEQGNYKLLPKFNDSVRTGL